MEEELYGNITMANFVQGLESIATSDSEDTGSDYDSTFCDEVPESNNPSFHTWNHSRPLHENYHFPPRDFPPHRVPRNVNMEEVPPPIPPLPSSERPAEQTNPAPTRHFHQWMQVPQREPPGLPLWDTRNNSREEVPPPVLPPSSGGRPVDQTCPPRRSPHPWRQVAERDSPALMPWPQRGTSKEKEDEPYEAPPTSEDDSENYEQMAGDTHEGGGTPDQEGDYESPPKDGEEDWLYHPQPHQKTIGDFRGKFEPHAVGSFPTLQKFGHASSQILFHNPPFGLNNASRPTFRPLVPSSVASPPPTGNDRLNSITSISSSSSHEERSEEENYLVMNCSSETHPNRQLKSPLNRQLLKLFPKNSKEQSGSGGQANFSQTRQAPIRLPIGHLKYAGSPAMITPPWPPIFPDPSSKPNLVQTNPQDSTHPSEASAIKKQTFPSKINLKVSPFGVEMNTRPSYPFHKKTSPSNEHAHQASLPDKTSPPIQAGPKELGGYLGRKDSERNLSSNLMDKTQAQPMAQLSRFPNTNISAQKNPFNNAMGARPKINVNGFSRAPNDFSASFQSPPFTSQNPYISSPQVRNQISNLTNTPIIQPIPKPSKQDVRDRSLPVRTDTPTRLATHSPSGISSKGFSPDPVPPRDFTRGIQQPKPGHPKIPFNSPKNKVLWLDDGTDIPMFPAYKELLGEIYFWPIAKTSVRKYLTENTFLLRPSSVHSSERPLTLCVKHNQKTYTFEINQRPSGKYAIGTKKEGEMEFTSVANLVKFHSENKFYFSNNNSILLKNPAIPTESSPAPMLPPRH